MSLCDDVVEWAALPSLVFELAFGRLGLSWQTLSAALIILAALPPFFGLKL